MAMAHCFYRLETVGTGRSPREAFRASLAPFVTEDAGAGTGFWAFRIRSRSAQYAYAVADEAALNAAEADPQNKPISTRFASAVAARSWLDAPADGSAAALISQLESDNIPVHWRTAAHTPRDLLRFASKCASCVGNITTLGARGMALFVWSLDDALALVPAGIRGSFLAWLDRHGIDRTDFSALTTVRDAIARVVARGNWPVSTLGEVTL